LTNSSTQIQENESQNEPLIYKKTFFTEDAIKTYSSTNLILILLEKT